MYRHYYGKTIINKGKLLFIASRYHCVYKNKHKYKVMKFTIFFSSYTCSPKKRSNRFEDGNIPILQKKNHRIQCIDFLNIFIKKWMVDGTLATVPRSFKLCSMHYTYDALSARKCFVHSPLSLRIILEHLNVFVRKKVHSNDTPAALCVYKFQSKEKFFLEISCIVVSRRMNLTNFFLD